MIMIDHLYIVTKIGRNKNSFVETGKKKKIRAHDALYLDCNY
jgi:hypothetical protein